MDSGLNSVVVTGLTVSRGAGSVTVVTTSATVAADVVLIAVNLNQCHEVFLFASYEVIIAYSIIHSTMYTLGMEAIGYVPPNILLILKSVELVRMHIIQSSVSQHTLYLIMQMAIIGR